MRHRPGLSLVLMAAVPSVILVAAVGYMVLGRDEVSGLTVYSAAPDFALTDQLERPVRSADLRGSVVVANFIYTNCHDICPLLSVQMQQLQDRLRQAGMLGSAVQLLSFTVDPARDTPAVLRAYAAQHQADPQAWRFLTGPKETVEPLIVNGFHLGVDALPPASESAGADDGGQDDHDYQVVHSGRFVLIDRQGRIRAYYDGREFDADRVMHDIRSLLR